MWLDPATILLRNLNCMHTCGESLARVRSEQGVARRGFREAEPPGASRLPGVKNSTMCGRREERKVREPQRMSWKFCWSPPPPLPTHPRCSRPSALSKKSCHHPDDLDYQGKMVLRRASAAKKQAHVNTRGSPRMCSAHTWK